MAAPIHRLALGQAAPGGVPPRTEAAIRGLAGGGQPLPQSVRDFFEPRFGADFRPVRVHTGTAAGNLAAGLQAKAFTVGRNIFFGQGQYSPGTQEGTRLLAHELTHVAQQGGGLHSGGLFVQRRTVSRTYATAAFETGPLCDVRLAIINAPESDTEDLTEFIDAAESGILRACGTLPRSSSRAIRVRLQYRRGLAHYQVEQRAFVAARISVLGRAGDPAYIAEQERLAAERARVAQLEANYRAAVQSGAWQMAAEYLNGFNDADIASRLSRLDLMQLGELRRGAVRNPRLGGGGRLAAAIDAANSEARRVATLIDNYENALDSSNFESAAEYLNGFSDADIRTRLARLPRVGLSLLRDGAVRNPRLGGGARLVGLIDAQTGRVPLQGVGYACFDGATITVTKNRLTHSCDAFSGSVGAPTPPGRFCIRMQGAAQIRGGLRGLFQDRSSWYLLEPQFTTSRSRMQLHPGVMSSGCITVRDRACFDRLAAVLNSPGLDFGRGYDGYPPGNAEHVDNPERSVSCVAWLDVSSSPGSCAARG